MSGWVHQYQDSLEKFSYSIMKTWGQDNSVGIVTELGAGQFRDRILVGARFSTPAQTGRGAHPPSYTMGTGSFLGLKWLGHLQVIRKITYLFKSSNIQITFHTNNAIHDVLKTSNR